MQTASYAPQGRPPTVYASEVLDIAPGATVEYTVSGAFVSSSAAATTVHKCSGENAHTLFIA